MRDSGQLGANVADIRPDPQQYADAKDKAK